MSERGRLWRAAIDIDLRMVGASTVLIVCVLFGGTTARYSLGTSLCLITALIVLAGELWARPGIDRGDRTAVVLLAAGIALGLLQLIPLPPSIWQSLPGRTLVKETLEAARLTTDTYRPLSLDPIATGASILNLMPALAVFLAASRLNRSSREQLVMLLIMLVLLSVLYGSIRAAGMTLPWDSVEAPRFLRGFFSNQNHQASLLLIALASCVSVLALHGHRGPLVRPLLILSGTIFAAAVVGTTSRAGIGLLAVVMPACAGILLSQKIIQLKRAVAAFSVVAALALLLWIIAPNFLPRLVERFETQGVDDDRFRIWQEVVVVAQAYFPAGSGLGTFDRVYMIFERLDYLSPVFLNQAHNEYLQVVVEGGLAGSILLIAGLAWYIARSYRAWHGNDALAKGASIALGIYALHSLGDYPLRTTTHAAVFGLMLALIIQRPRESEIRHPGKADYR